MLLLHSEKLSGLFPSIPLVVVLDIQMSSPYSNFSLRTVALTRLTRLLNWMICCVVHL